ncbi:hypothetical protein Dsin_032071 [Dipteronia sinensis]|uniref:Uncharacterized protein n=1 Tax=Dipteronia sinensis TaxID=43782 RepID=A0AAD9ZNK7_9ROSI|nr:hypothetical protein Dsin_032071 [Dipteronia sinensis]
MSVRQRPPTSSQQSPHLGYTIINRSSLNQHRRYRAGNPENTITATVSIPTSHLTNPIQHSQPSKPPPHRHHPSLPTPHTHIHQQRGLPDLRKYKIRFMDGVHAIMSVLVFGAVALRDKNVLGCLYPTPKHETQQVLNILPVGIGLICSLLFVAFPTIRHGIGYPITPGK